jgi:hypothetical protein
VTGCTKGRIKRHGGRCKLAHEQYLVVGQEIICIWRYGGEKNKIEHNIGKENFVTQASFFEEWIVWLVELKMVW